MSFSSQLTEKFGMQNSDDSLSDAIDRLQSTLEDARAMPSWSAAVLVIVALLCAIITIHVLAFIVVGPCVWAAWKRRAAGEEPFEQEHEEEGIELTPSVDEGEREV